MSITCMCDKMASAGDMAPRLWDCYDHGKTGMIGFAVLFTGHSEHTIREAKDEFWHFCKGVQMIKTAEKRVRGEVYYSEDYLWTDVRMELDRISKLTGRATVDVGRFQGNISSRAFGVSDAPQYADGEIGFETLIRHLQYAQEHFLNSRGVHTVRVEVRFPEEKTES